MDENTKRRFDAVAKLSYRAWENLHKRRAYEWRVAFTLWTAFALFLGILLTGQLSASKGLLFSGCFVMGLIMCLIHAYWLNGLGISETFDREMAIHFESLLQQMSNSEFNDDLQARLDKRRKELARPLDWSRRPQLAVSVVLYIAILLVIIAKA